jgi:hypothetical protein
MNGEDTWELQRPAPGTCEEMPHRSLLVSEGGMVSLEEWGLSEATPPQSKTTRDNICIVIDKPLHSGRLWCLQIEAEAFLSQFASTK